LAWTEIIEPFRRSDPGTIENREGLGAGLGPMSDANNACQVSVLYTTHRPETVDALFDEMRLHEAVFLEEPPTADFPDMLEGRISIEDYLMNRDDEYPEFSRRSCRMFQALHRKGVLLFQVEPFIEELLGIHEFFADGSGPSDLTPGTMHHRVYMAEHLATRALLDFYRISVAGTFEETVAAVKIFARTDARRFRLRDEMRADALAEVVGGYGSAAVEAGYMHALLWRLLKRRAAADARVRPVYLMQEPMAEAGARRRNLGPGDVLTLHYLFNPERDDPVLDLLAARSLMYAKFLEKEEMIGRAGQFPHLKNEMETNRITDVLSYEDCRRLYPLIRRSGTAKARRIALGYMARQGKRS
jgi:hypothetical protein